MEQEKILEQEEKLKRSKEKSEKGTRGKKLKGAGSKGGNCERSKEHGPPQQRLNIKPESTLN